MTTKWIGCSLSNFTVGRQGNKVDKIVLHWMAGTLASTDATFQDGRRQASAHYGIGQTEVHQYVKEEDTAWHAGNWEVNLTSIGIEHEGGPDIPITENVYKQSVELVTDICKRYNIPADKDHIHKHNEYKATQCPGTLDVDRIIREANLALQSSQISDDEKRALEYVKANKADSNYEGAVRQWHGAFKDHDMLADKAKRLDALLVNLRGIWALDNNADEAEILTQAKLFLLTEDARQQFRDSIEECVGNDFPSDVALLEAHKAVKRQIKILTDERDSLQQKLLDVKAPTGYKYAGVSASWSIVNWLFKIIKYKKAGD